MAILPTVGRRSWKLRFVVALLYVVLSIGAVTMVYPFLLMFGTSLTSDSDYTEFRPIPRYLYDKSALFAKEAEIRYAQDILEINRLYGTDFASLRAIEPPQVLPESRPKRAFIRQWNGAVNYFEGQIRGMDRIALPYQQVDTPEARALIADWKRFKQTLPLNYFHAGYTGWVANPTNAPSRLMDSYRSFLERKYSNLEELNQAYVEENETIATVLPPSEREYRREWQPADSFKQREWESFKQRLPERYKIAVSADAWYRRFLREDKYGDDIKRLNAAWEAGYNTFGEISLSPEIPEHPQVRSDWEEFVRRRLPVRYLRVDSSARDDWESYLLAKHGTFQLLREHHEVAYPSPSDIPLPETLPAEGQLTTDYLDFIARVAPLESLHPDNTEIRYRQWLRENVGEIEAVNARYGASYSAFQQISPPYQLADWEYVSSNAGELRSYFAFANFRLVWNYIARHGRAVFVTVVFVVLAILTHLIVNPLCAYSLSRYNLRYGHRVLLFLLATMAFPAEVAMIPSFLLLKELNLLNTFAALILPGMASGYSIFLLKGFFDSLPRELYEAGIIDGASEARMFFQITVPLSKPVLAVIALSSFTLAYGSFMFAFLVCQDPRMWTIMVWLYELQIAAPSYVVMAALTIAAVPTLMVFVFAQNIIMRGIILPSFK